MPSILLGAAVLLLTLSALVATPAGALAPLHPQTTIEEYVTGELKVPLESHYTTTDDGYILHLHRLPRPGRPVVFLQHGILASSWCWLVNERNQSLGLALWDAGYDVFLGNSRGNTFSANHTSLPVKSREFWNYTFNDMGHHDLYVSVDAALKISSRESLTYVGWSQGNTAMLIGGTDPQISSRLQGKINLWIALSPVSFLSHSKSPLLSAISLFHLGAIVDDLYPYGFLRSSEDLSRVEELFCKLTFNLICKVTIDVICGTSDHDSPVMIDRLATHFPAGTSVKDLDHYEQFIESNPAVFQQFDYGRSLNEKYYHSTSPPAYNLANFSKEIPVALFAGGSDILVEPADLDLLLSGLPASVVKHFKVYPDISHVSWLVGTEAAYRSWAVDALNLVAKYNQ